MPVPDPMDARMEAVIQSCGTRSVADLLLSLLRSAAASSNHASLLDPWPHCPGDARLTRTELLAIIDGMELPPTREWLARHRRSMVVLEYGLGSMASLVEVASFQAWAAVRDRADTIVGPFHRPDFYFSVLQEGNTPDGPCTRYAFHGSSCPNFHTILPQGLRRTRNRRAAFGAGTYLTSDLSVAMGFSKMDRTWAKCPTEKISIVAVCKVIHVIYIWIYICDIYIYIYATD